jgi:hypothetical protein
LFPIVGCSSTHIRLDYVDLTDRNVIAESTRHILDERLGIKLTYYKRNAILGDEMSL